MTSQRKKRELTAKCTKVCRGSKPSASAPLRGGKSVECIMTNVKLTGKFCSGWRRPGPDAWGAKGKRRSGMQGAEEEKEIREGAFGRDTRRYGSN